MARVLLPTGYLMNFNLSRASRHELVRTGFIGRQRRLWRPLEAVAVWRPGAHYDLVHSFNRVPLTRRPWLVTFESSLPRTKGPQHERLRAVLRERLLRPNCTRVIAMSAFARRQFEHQSRDWPDAAVVLAKTDVLLPNLPVRVDGPRRWQRGTPLRLAFVGNDWARKGGIVAARLAKEMQRRRLPVHIDIVSSFRAGFTDDPRRELYTADLSALMSSENVTCHGRMGNEHVHELLDASHMLLLPTLSDTFGFSVLEGFAHALPALVSNVCALPELVSDGDSGLVIDLPTNAIGRWVHEGRRSWPLLDDAWTDLATQAADGLEQVFDGTRPYEAMSEGALRRLREQHDPRRAGRVLDDLYSAAMAATLRGRAAGRAD